MEFPFFAARPCRLWQIKSAGEFFRRGCKVSVLNAALVAEFLAEKRGGVGQRLEVRPGVEFVEEVSQAAIKGITLCGKYGHLGKRLGPHTLPSSKSPST